MQSFEQVYETLPGSGWLSKEEAKLLWECCNRTSGPILEVGCYQGRSTTLLASQRQLEEREIWEQGFTSIGPDYRIHIVEPFEGFCSEDMLGVETEKAFWRNMYDRKLDNIIVYHQKIEDWNPTPVSLAFLDGDHTYLGTLCQIVKAKQCHPKIIAIHDVNDTGEGAEVKRAAVELLGQWNRRVERLAIWILD